jgi:hypothetical protein
MNDLRISASVSRVGIAAQTAFRQDWRSSRTIKSLVVGGVNILRQSERISICIELLVIRGLRQFAVSLQALRLQAWRLCPHVQGTMQKR